MRTLRALAVLIAAFALTACVDARPNDDICTASSEGTPSAYGASVASALQEKWRNAKTRERVSILVLSGGGAWGAYGAGFLNGWSARPASLGGTRPVFDVVTGVSTGAVIGTFALLGPDYDSTLEQAYRGRGSHDLFESRSYLSLPFWNSFNDPKPIEQGLTQTLNDETIARLKDAYLHSRSLWAGAVNFDSGHFTEFDLTALAAGMPPDQARKAIIDRLMAASAVPGFFPPRFIDHCMYMDGGVRENLFISQIGQAIKEAMGPKAAHASAQVDIYAIVNGNMSPSPRRTGDTLIDIGIRGFELASDQIQLASMREIYDYAKANGFHLYWTSADDVVIHDGDKVVEGRCSAPRGMKDQFDGPFTACLFDKAKEKAETAPLLWRTDRP
ncbi:MAG TPA: patatin-like phospholipase family protein [Rhizomicrobium sp.]|nr:patatin-like phospholipase family protein [Rhizomicrobium sp.]